MNTHMRKYQSNNFLVSWLIYEIKSNSNCIVFFTRSDKLIIKHKEEIKKEGKRPKNTNQLEMTEELLLR